LSATISQQSEFLAVASTNFFSIGQSRGTQGPGFRECTLGLATGNMLLAACKNGNLHILKCCRIEKAAAVLGEATVGKWHFGKCGFGQSDVRWKCEVNVCQTLSCMKSTDISK
jgi:hypothetical protein